MSAVYAVLLVLPGQRPCQGRHLRARTGPNPATSSRPAGFAQSAELSIVGVPLPQGLSN